MLRQRLKTLLADQFPSETPFTIQRLAELLLEPHKQYSRLDKLVQFFFAHCIRDEAYWKMANKVELQRT